MLSKGLCANCSHFIQIGFLTFHFTFQPASMGTLTFGRRVIHDRLVSMYTGTRLQPSCTQSRTLANNKANIFTAFGLLSFDSLLSCDVIGTNFTLKISGRFSIKGQLKRTKIKVHEVDIEQRPINTMHAN